MPEKQKNSAANTLASAAPISRYTESTVARLHSGRSLRVALIAMGASLGLTAGGCSTSVQLSSLTGKDERAGSAAALPLQAVAAKPASALRDADLALAKAAAVEVLALGTKDASVPWENPRTGARGTATPIASSYTLDGATCHDFLASYVLGSQESWYQGGACRTGSKWVVRDIRPLQRT